MEYSDNDFYTFLGLDSAIYYAVNGTVRSLEVFNQNILNCVPKMNEAFTGLERHGGKWEDCFTALTTAHVQLSAVITTVTSTYLTVGDSKDAKIHNTFAVCRLHGRYDAQVPPLYSLLSWQGTSNHNPPPPISRIITGHMKWNPANIQQTASLANRSLLRLELLPSGGLTVPCFEAQSTH